MDRQLFIKDEVESKLLSLTEAGGQCSENAEEVDRLMEWF
jgi:hypothetical protein